MSNNRKILSWELRAFHRHAIQKLLDKMQDGKWYFTMQFEHVSSSFTGRANRPLLRQCLRTLESEGTIECKQFTKTSHEWRLKPQEEPQ